LAAEIKHALPGRVHDVELIPSGGGVFEIRSGQRLIFSKKQQGRFPETSEVLQQIEAA
jgi:selenoprotein W-related protein